MTRNTALWVGTALAAVAIAVAGIAPYDRLTWLLEVFPALIVYPILWATQKRVSLTSMLYTAIAVHAVVLAIGGAYTYARVPLGFWIADALGLHRNPYDKIGHLFQGFVPALAAREVLIRGSYIRGKGMLAFVVICIVMAISATYELVEWAAAISLGQGADEFLGTQGDPWDTQSDMFCALIGGSLALLLLSRFHDRQIAKNASPAAL